MIDHKKILEPEGIQLHKELTASGFRVFRTQDARVISKSLGIRESYFLKALNYLQKRNWVETLSRGLYAISSTNTGIMPITEMEIAMRLAKPVAISHWTAMMHHGLSDQIPQIIYMLSTKGNRLPRSHAEKKGNLRVYRIGGFLYHLSTVSSDKYFGIEKKWIGEAKISITDRERTLVDGLIKPGKCGGMIEVIHAFEMVKQALKDSGMDLIKIITYGLKIGGFTAKRLGWALERQGHTLSQLKPLLAVPVKNYGPLDPTRKMEGSYNKTWMLQENLSARKRSWNH